MIFLVLVNEIHLKFGGLVILDIFFYRPENFLDRIFLSFSSTLYLLLVRSTIYGWAKKEKNGKKEPVEH